LSGAAGFIGMHTAMALLSRGDEVIGLDNLNAYYDPSLKQARLRELAKYQGFRFVRCELADRSSMASTFATERPEGVVHLAAQAGVRASIANPHAYADSNLTGFLNVLEGCRDIRPRHLVYASSSSVYGLNSRMPFTESEPTDHPASLYAATKKANEVMAHAYAHLFDLPVTGLRFFTVYGPWGRPDMALFSFTRKILSGEPIDVYNNGDHERDFTYIDDIVRGVVSTLDRPAKPAEEFDPARPTPEISSAPARIYNIGGNQPVSLLEFIRHIEVALGKPAVRRFLPLQAGDVPKTYADTSRIEALAGFKPETPLAEGIARFLAWYRSYYSVSA
jgi:UDP-glucuronate 4-epimerase